MLSQTKYTNAEIPLLLTNVVNDVDICLEKRLQAYPHDDFSLSTVCVHAGGKDKFWNNKALRLYHQDWLELYNYYLSLGGNPSTDKDISPIGFRTHRQSFFLISLSGFWYNHIFKQAHIYTSFLRLRSDIISTELEFVPINQDHTYKDVSIVLRVTGGTYSYPDKIIFTINYGRESIAYNTLLQEFLNKNGYLLDKNKKKITINASVSNNLETYFIQIKRILELLGSIF